jgi:uncharacterized protein YndB with AHSA1/START domain
VSDTVIADTELRVERLIPAPPERVFALWTEPEQLVKWWGPEGYQVPAIAMDVRPGGSWRTTMIGTDGVTRTVSGVYRAIEPPRRLVMTWGWLDDKGGRGHETEITVTFAPAPGGTKLVLLQKEFATKSERDGHNVGWSSSFDKLARIGA